ncbi:phage holin [Brochothrix campestris]|uniref:Holin, phage phi LC3 family protein n=1 Tax=Brochothrix campestris FSL F6-1037 TaxID=1265861 RepID=W7D9Q2_9LIST|nr:phage holin [Brochothrix campestris]EUJ41988.1 holin, phage phi LC3 family protein [Brochothrix campestris FSL F6-1037]
MKNFLGINWQVRIKSKMFWVAIIPAILFLCSKLLIVVGIDFNFTQLQSQLLDIVGAVFSVLVLLGVVIDPTTEGATDSSQAQKYDNPKGDK